jgi:hypothetical protein
MYFGHVFPAPVTPDAAGPAVALEEIVEDMEDAAAEIALAAIIAAAAADAGGEPWPAELAALTAEEEAAVAAFFAVHPWPPLEELGLGAWINEN